MRFSGRITKIGRWWAIEVPLLGIVKKYPVKKEAYGMIAQVIESLSDREGFRIDVYPGLADTFEIGSSDTAALCALFLRRQRIQKGLTQREVAQRLGLKSHNAYARYEQGTTVPSVAKLFQLLSAVSPDLHILLIESRIQHHHPGSLAPSRHPV